MSEKNLKQVPVYAVSSDSDSDEEAARRRRKQNRATKAEVNKPSASINKNQHTSTGQPQRQNPHQGPGLIANGGRFKEQGPFESRKGPRFGYFQIPGQDPRHGQDRPQRGSLKSGGGVVDLTQESDDEGRSPERAIPIDLDGPSAKFLDKRSLPTAAASRAQKLSSSPTALRDRIPNFSASQASPATQYHISKTVTSRPAVATPSSVLKGLHSIKAGDLLDKSVSIVKKCERCRHDDEPCNGNKPCQRCLREGYKCIFDGFVEQDDRLQSMINEVRREVANTESTRKSSGANNGLSRSKPASERMEDVDMQDIASEDVVMEEAAPGKPSKPRTIADLLWDHLDDETESEVQSEDTETEDPSTLDLGYFEALVSDVKRRMEAFHAEFVQGSLRAAAHQTSTNTSIASAAIHSRPKPNPFDRIVRKKGPMKPVLQTRVRKTDKWEPILAPVTVISSPTTSLPKTKSIGRLGPSVLSRNVTIGKYYPYSLDDEGVLDQSEKYKEVEERYHDFGSNAETFAKQRTCAELVGMYRQFIKPVLGFLKPEDVIRYYLSSEKDCMSHCDIAKAKYLEILLQGREAVCKTCELDCKVDKRQKLLRRECEDNPFDSEVYVKAGLLAHAFSNITRISLWHLVVTECRLSPLDKNIEANEEDEVEQICLACGLHNCSIHGRYVEKSADSGDPSADKVLLDEPEPNMNERWCFATYANPVSKQDHVCGIWCTNDPDRSLPLESLRGVDEDGNVSGYLNATAKISTPYLDDSETCSEDCFWRKKKRDSKAPLPTLTPLEEEVFLSNLRQCLSNQRGACMMKDMLPNIRCCALFALMVERVRKHPYPPREGVQEPVVRRKGKAKPKPKIDLSRDYPPTERAAFFPCDHPGPCLPDKTDKVDACRCATDHVACEVSCNCADSCERRFRGCSCGTGPGNVCSDSKCACWNSGRECDPVLCRGCGVETVLHQAYKYEEKMRIHRCRNNRIQLGLPARTIKAPSEVQGYGLFAGQDLKKGDFINEYRGEIISRGESDRRGAIYSLAGQEYLFSLNLDQEVDANTFGNKARFMNNSSKEENINVFGSTMLCSGQHRIGLYAKRDIKAGEELLYNYAYPEAVREQFWERGEKSSKLKATPSVRMPVAAHARVRRTTPRQPRGSNKEAAARRDEHSSQSPLAHRGGRRKRRGLQSSSSRASLREEDTDFDPMRVDQTAQDFNEQAEELDPDYGAGSSSEEEEDADPEIADSDEDDEIANAKLDVKTMANGKVAKSRSARK